MADLPPPLEAPAGHDPAPPPNSPVAADPPAAPPDRAHSAWRARLTPGHVALAAVLAVIVFYGVANVLLLTGLYDVRQWWSSSSTSPRLTDVPAASRTPNAGALAGRTAPIPETARHEPPPRPTPGNLPEFTVRDGAQYDFMLDLDAETLKRLAEIQGQLDGLGAVVGQLNQAVQALARHGEGQRQQEAVHQGRVQQDLGAARQEIAALRTALGEVEARLKRARAGQGPGGLDAASGGRALPGWSVTAISGDRAWLRSPKGQTVTAVAGDRLKGAGAVRAVDAARGVVTLDDGRVVR